MPSAPFQPQGIVAEALADTARASVAVEKAIRLTSRGEPVCVPMLPDLKSALMEGTYYIASTPTPATGITLSVATGTSFSDTQGLVGINNSDAVGGKTIYLDFIAFVVTTAPTAATQHDVAYRLDNGQRSSGGTAVASVNANMNFGNNSVAKVFANPTIVAATGAIRHLGHQTIRKAAAPAYIVGDLVIIKFGGVDWAGNVLANFTLTTQTAIIVPAPPVAIGPNQSFVLNEWAASRSAALSGEVFVGYVER